jgi:hypothetical protein
LTTPPAVSFQVTCKTCGAFVLVPGDTDFHRALVCDCCLLGGRDHDHKASAQQCTGASDTPGPQGHEGVSCPYPLSGRYCEAVTPSGEECPGGHCGPGIEGCTVCRPIAITGLPGLVKINGLGA